MSTTVSVSNETHRKMRKVKEKKGVASFDKLLDDLMERELDLPDSLMGEADIKVDKDDIRDRNDRTERYKR